MNTLITYLKDFLFERPIELTVTLFIVWACVGIVWMSCRINLWKRVFFGWGSLCILLPILNVAIHSENEQVIQVMQQMTKDVEKKGSSALLSYVNPKYKDENVSFERLKQQIMGQWSQVKFKGLTFHFREMKRLPGNRIRVQVSCVGKVSSEGQYMSFARTYWNLDWHKEAKQGQWAISKIVPLQLNLPNGNEPGNLGDMLRMSI